jgi:aspartyl-tRNA synthetase
MANNLNNSYRSHTCNQLTLSNVDTNATLSGFIHRKRDHGNVLFVDLRDAHGITQCVIEGDNPLFPQIEALRVESVIKVSGSVIARTADTINPNMPTGEVELGIEQLEVLSTADTLPFPVNQDVNTSEELRLTYRYLDLRRQQMQHNLQLRSNVIRELRQQMQQHGFMEIQTPILTASSPEGARDYLVPSRLHRGKFYALPQAPQMFKQLLMASGVERYFQIAPCFRDEDSRADRSPGEFYQLDFEMAFANQEDVFAVLEPVLRHVFNQFKPANYAEISASPFPRISYEEAMLKYGSDKPDLRNPLICSDVSEIFAGSDFGLFANLVAKGQVVRAIPAYKVADKPRSFFDKLNDYARDQGFAGLGYILFTDDGTAKGPIAKRLDQARLDQLKAIGQINNGDALFFAAGTKDEVCSLVNIARTKIGQELAIITEDVFKFCWVVDFPYYELDDNGKLDFSHNPFSMPQGGEQAIDSDDVEQLLRVKAYQYDIVCNGIELSSGAIRNHDPELMIKAFAKVGYTRQQVEQEFRGMINAFKYGVPPHGGSAPGVDRIIMLLADEPNIREVIAFPLNQQAQDLMMNAPSEVSAAQLKTLGLQKIADVKSHK